MYCYEYPRPSITVDCCVFGYDDGKLKVLLVKRKDEPFAGQWALPGGFVNVSDDGDQGEDLEAAARRELSEETGVQLSHLEQLATFGKPGRDPRGRVIDVAYLALVRVDEHGATAGSDASEAVWFNVDQLSLGALAFDHCDILELALQRLAAKVRYAPIGFGLLPKRFTIPELLALYESILGRKLDPSNFRKKVLSSGVIAKTEHQRHVADKPAWLYRFDKRAYDKATREGFNFEL